MVPVAWGFVPNFLEHVAQSEPTRTMTEQQEEERDPQASKTIAQVSIESARRANAH